MYNASADFHRAVFEAGAEQRVLVKFTDNTIFTNEDIAISQGIKVIETVNPDEELTIGSAPSAEFTATIINDKGLLNGYTYGEADVLLGVRTASYAADLDRPTAILRYGGESPVVFKGSRSLPYLKVNSHAPTVQPPFGVAAILIYGATVYCISVEGELWAATWVDGSTWNELAQLTWGDIPTETWDDIQGGLVPVSESISWDDLASHTWDELSNTTWQSFAPWFETNAFMTEKAAKWAKENKGFWFNSNILYEFGETAVDKYEYVPLGKFIINTPSKRRKSLVAISAFDRMSKFDIDATEFWNNIQYPTTIGNIFANLCEFVDIPRATITFINSTRSFAEAPATYDAITAREILKWIAEAACSYARMTRDGEVELVWFGTEAVSIPMTQYFSIDAAEYNVPQINKLQVMSAENDIGVIIGTGTNGYQIVDNPMLYGATDAQIRAYATPIYNRLASFDAFSPISANAVCDWSVQAGDIIEIIIDDVTYVLPVYNQTITWKGGAKAVYESTGSVARPVMDAVNRTELSSGRKFFKISATVDGLDLALTNNALSFDADGLHIYNGCIDIFDENDVKVFGVDTDGRLELTGDITSDMMDTFGHAWTTKLSKSAFQMLYDGTSVASITNVIDTTTGNFRYSRFDVGVSLMKSLYTESLLIGAENTSSVNAPLYASYSGNYTQIGNTSSTCYMHGVISINSSATLQYALPAGGSYAANVRQNTDAPYNWYRSTSSRRYKQDIEDIGLDIMPILDALRPVEYYSSDRNLFPKKQYGLIAEEVYELSPLFVAFGNNEDNGDLELYEVHYQMFIPLLIKDAQDTHKRLDNIEKELEAMKNVG